MARLSYEIAEALIYDPVSANRNATRSALVEMGFRRIESVSAPDAFARLLYMRSPDLVLCEIQADDTQVCPLISSLRGGSLGYNPFVIVIATTWDKSRAMVHRVIEAGADDLILRPFSNGSLAARVDAHAERRRGFVITHDYIGPDRRRDPIRISSRLFEPPNSLKMKVTGHTNAEAVAAQLETELRSARGFLNAEKIHRDAFQICVLHRLLVDDTPGLQTFVDNLAQASTLARNVVKRNGEVRLPDVPGCCERVIEAASAIEQGDVSAAALQRLDKAAFALLTVVAPAASEKERRTEIERAIATIRAREASLQAS